MVLIIDDKPENIFSLKRTLELHNFQVDSAGSGEEALKKVLDKDFSLIILDVQMPGMDGFEVAEALSGYSKSRDIPIIFLSAVNTNKNFIARGYTSGGIDYITKPVDPDIFILKVKTLHKLYEQKRELSRISEALKDEIETRKNAEKELSKKVEELHTILESMPQVAFTLTPDGELEYTNDQWHLYSTHKKRFPDFHPNDRHYTAEWQKAIKQGIVFISEIRIKNIETGQFVYHLLKITPVRQGDRIVKWIGTFTDINVQKAATEILETTVKDRTKELIEKNHELEASNHELQQFASVASHDLKEPVRKIQIFSSILMERFSKDHDPAADDMSRIINAAQRMSSLINDLLDYSRLSSHALFNRVSLEEIVNEIKSDLELMITEKEAEINISMMPEIDCIPGQMRQMFQNLIGNSLKFTRPGVKPIINITAELIDKKSVDPLQGVDADTYCLIRIKDNGIGFHESYSEKIFTIFQRLNNREEYEGTGIGLAIVKKIIAKHNGSIVAKGKEGEGAEFIITLPLHQSIEQIPVEI